MVTPTIMMLSYAHLAALDGHTSVTLVAAASTSGSDILQNPDSTS